jgi:hypothetical protein
MAYGLLFGEDHSKMKSPNGRTEVFNQFGSMKVGFFWTRFI